MVDRNTFREYFKKASERQLYLIDSKYSGTNLYKISQKYSFDEQKDILFCRTVSEIILGFYKIEDTVPLLQQELGLDARTAALLGADVLEFLAPLSDPNWQPPVEDEYVVTEVEGNTISVPEMPANSIANVSSGVPEETAVQMSVQNVPAVAQPAPVSVSTAPIYTPTPQPIMRSGMTPIIDNAAPVYTSNQADIKPPLSDLPSYNAPLYQNPKPAPDAPIERPRWGS